jgi:anti-sigma factor RsiW
MEPCDDRWRDELLDHALGLPASAPLTEHLENCSVCSETLREWRARAGLIAAGIRQLAASEPSSQVVPSVVAEVSTRRERMRSPAWKWARATLSGLVIVAASFVYLRKVREQRHEDEKAFSAAEAIGHWRSPTEGLLRSSTNRWMEAPPQLGQYFYRLNTDVRGKESENP